MSAIIVDRRIGSRDKNSPNRQRFIERVKQAARGGVRQLISGTSVKDLSSDSNKKINIPSKGLDEPRFAHQPGTGRTDRVVPGNDKYFVGDKLKKPPGGNGQGEASDSGEGEDSFSFELTKDEFMDLLFDQCELPDLVKQAIARVVEQERRRTGFRSDGPPSALNVVRSMRGAKARRCGLGAEKRKRIRELQDEYDVLSIQSSYDAKARCDEILAEIEELKSKIRKIPFLDPVDLKFTSWDMVDIPTVQAVVMCVMDVSGSMDQEKKTLAKIFYLLLYLFITRSYERVEIVFVTYHSVAKEVDEQEFWYGRQTGGTVTSAGLEEVKRILLERYPTDTWNAYIAHASDGDNFQYDNVVVRKLLEEDILPIVQYYAYVQVHSSSWSDPNDAVGLWSIMDPLSKTFPHLSAVKVHNEADVYPVFVKLFQRKGVLNGSV